METLTAYESLTVQIKEAARAVSTAPNWQAYQSAYREWARLLERRAALSPRSRVMIP